MLSRPQAWPLGAGLLVSLCLNACVAPLELDRSLAMPTQYDEAAAPHTTVSPELQHWWRRFDDPLLAELVERAVAHNYDVRIALASVQSARAQALRAQSALLPQIGAAASADRYWIDPDNEQLAQQGYDEFRVDQWQLALQTSWEVDLFGSTRLRLQAAQQQQLASLAEVHATRLSIAASLLAAASRFSRSPFCDRVPWWRPPPSNRESAAVRRRATAESSSCAAWTGFLCVLWAACEAVPGRSTRWRSSLSKTSRLCAARGAESSLRTVSLTICGPERGDASRCAIEDERTVTQADLRVGALGLRRGGI